MMQYRNLAKMLKEVVEKRKQLKTVLYSSQNQTKNISAAYSLLSTVINNLQKFQLACKKISRQTKQKVRDVYFLYILMAEMVNMGTIRGGGKLKSLIIANQHLLPKIERKSKINKQNVQIRIRALQEGYKNWKQKISKFSHQTFLDNVYTMDSQSYSKVVKEFPSILSDKNCVIQSLSSALPAYLLLAGLRYQQMQSSQPIDIIDACSAPGNKTLQLAEYAKNFGKVFAFEKNNKRYELLNKNLQKYQCKNTETLNQDFLTIKASDKKYKHVKFVMLDPSCSGSGMLTNFQRDNQIQPNGSNDSFQSYCSQKYSTLSKQQKDRVEKLHEFQINLLLHAATFNPVRLSYSTCSIYERENQDVVRKFLISRPDYCLKKNKDISRIQSQKYPYIVNGFKQLHKCVRIDPRSRQSDGFFVAVFRKCPQ